VPCQSLKKTSPENYRLLVIIFITKIHWLEGFSELYQEHQSVSCNFPKGPPIQILLSPGFRYEDRGSEKVNTWFKVRPWEITGRNSSPHQPHHKAKPPCIHPCPAWEINCNSAHFDFLGTKDHSHSILKGNMFSSTSFS
jgi:hypothetical protein